MSMNNRKIAGFMSAEGIYSLAFYIIMVAAIAGVGASVLTKKDSAKAAAAISLLRANFAADVATLGVPANITADYIVKMSGNLLTLDTDAILPGGGTVDLVPRTAAGGQYSINVENIASAAVCNAVGGVGWGTWSGYHVAAASSVGVSAGTPIPSTISTQSAARAICDDVPGTAASMMFGFNL